MSEQTKRQAELYGEYERSEMIEFIDFLVDHITQLEVGLQSLVDWEEGKTITAGLGVGSLASAYLHMSAYAKWVLDGKPLTVFNRRVAALSEMEEKDGD